MMEGWSIDAEAYQKGSLERIVFTAHRLQLFLEPRSFIAEPYLMTPDYECTPNHGVVFEYLFIYGMYLLIIFTDIRQRGVEPAAVDASL